FFFNDALTPASYPLSLHDALPILQPTEAWRIAKPQATEAGRVIRGGAGNGIEQDGQIIYASGDRTGVIHRACQGDDSLDTDTTVDRKSTRLNSSHQINSYAVFCLK